MTGQGVIGDRLCQIEGIEYKTAKICDSPNVEIGIQASELVVNMGAITADIEGMLSIRTDRENISRTGRLVVGYLHSQYSKCKVWCRVSGPGAIGVTYWT